jgi:hypothetical protein
MITVRPCPTSHFIISNSGIYFFSGIFRKAVESIEPGCPPLSAGKAD